MKQAIALALALALALSVCARAGVSSGDGVDGGLWRSGRSVGRALCAPQRLCTCATKIAALAAAVGVVYNSTGTVTCFDINPADFLNCADITGCGAGYC